MIFINRNLKLNTFGDTHSSEIGGLFMGIPAGFEIDMEEVRDMLDRRRPGASALVSQRNESDEPVFTGLAKLDDEKYMTTGDPIRVVFQNTDVKNADADKDFIPRPGHGDYTYYKNTGEFKKGATSARYTAPVVFAGAICKQYLASRGIFVSARMISPSEKEIEKVMKSGDSIGSVVECNIIGLPAGFGNPYAEKIESTISSCLFNIPGVKALEFGLGTLFASMQGSEANDQFAIDQNGEVRTTTNNCGGLLGGMASGSPVNFRITFKPTPSIAKEQQSVNLKTKEVVSIKSESRNDPCLGVRGAVVVEAAAAIAVCDICMRDYSRAIGGNHSCKGCSFDEDMNEVKAQILDGQSEDQHG